jgi:hypothetical protein
MGIPQTEAMLKKPPALHAVLPTIVPLAIVVCATSATMIIGERYGMDAMPFVLVGWCLVLIGLAVWLNHVLFYRTRTLLPFLAAVVAVLLVWFWQREAFTVLVPKAGLTYGYFLRPEGAHARFWVLVCPFWVGLVCLSVCCIVAAVLWWRAGVRGLLACMVPWWLAALIIFALPSMYLDAQGNASVFI